MKSHLKTIWIFDSDPTSLAMYHQTLGLQYKLKSFSDFNEFSLMLQGPPSEAEPCLLIADPEYAKGSLADFFTNTDRNKTEKHALNMVIVSRQDDLELMRFFLRVGVRDYILKPLRPSELVAKIERVLEQVGNSQSNILKNDLDGVHIGDLTFREHQILTILLNQPNRAASRDDLHDSVWNKVIVNRKTLDVHLFNLRRKLRPSGYDIVCQGHVFRLTKREEKNPPQ